jgi:hypothetical protein
LVKADESDQVVDLRHLAGVYHLLESRVRVGHQQVLVSPFKLFVVQIPNDDRFPCRYSKFAGIWVNGKAVSLSGAVYGIDNFQRARIQNVDGTGVVCVARDQIFSIRRITQCEYLSCHTVQRRTNKPISVIFVLGNEAFGNHSPVIIVYLCVVTVFRGVCPVLNNSKVPDPY